MLALSLQTAFTAVIMFSLQHDSGLSLEARHHALSDRDPGDGSRVRFRARLVGGLAVFSAVAAGSRGFRLR